MRRGVTLVVLLVAGLAVAPAAAAELRAERIREATAPELLIGGPDAIGGVGDWYLANDVVEVIVDDPSRAFATLNHGGSIVDAGLRDRRGEDQFARLFPLVNLDQRVFLGYHAMRAEVDPAGGWARLVVSSEGRMDSVRRPGLAVFLDWLVPDPAELADVRVETEYAVFPGEPFVHITTTLRNDGERAAPIFAYGDVWMRGGRSMRAFVGNALAPERSRGFHHVSFERRNLFAVEEALAAFTHVSVPGMRQFPPIAYALFSPERAEQGRLQYGVTGVHVNFANAFVGDPDWSELSLLRLARATLGELGPGETWSYRRRLLVTGRADTASTTDVMFPLLGFAEPGTGVRGRVEPASRPCVVHVSRAADGAPVTQIETAVDGKDAGRFRATLPPGRYVLDFRAPHQAPQQALVEVTSGAVAEVPTQRFPEPGFLRFGPAFSDGGPGRVVVRGVEATPDPTFGAELLDFRIDGEPVGSGTESNQLFFVGGSRDPSRVAVPPGRYELVATRGFEWDAERTHLSVPGPGAEVSVPPFELRRVVALQGIASADLHVHAQASDDSGMSNEARLASFVAEGVDVMVSTDHDRLGHFAEALHKLGVGERIHVVQGVEVTSSAPLPTARWTLGHHNAWPLTYRPLAHRRGAPPTQNPSVADLYARLRGEYGARVVQLNHPRMRQLEVLDEGAFFSHLGDGSTFRPELPLDAEPNRRLLATGGDGATRAIDFDAMEVMNGRSWGRYRLLRRDWYALLRQGYRRTATANSDTHGPGELAAYPRNYVYLGDAGFTPEGLDEAVLAGRLFGTNGPLIAGFQVNRGRMGDLVAAPGGLAVVDVQVAGAPWVPVDEVRLLVNGEVQRVWSGLPADEVLRLSTREELQLAADAFLTVEAGAPLDAGPRAWRAAHPGLYTEVLAPGFVANALSNPIWVDVDGNGRFDPPGLPPPPTTWRAAAAWSACAFALASAAFAASRFFRRRPAGA